MTYGNTSVITVEVPKNQTGFVTITIDELGINLTSKIVNGKAVFNIAGKYDVGNYTINVTYLGDDVFKESINSTNLTVIPANLTAEVIAQNVTVKDNLSYVLNITDDFKGKVNIIVNGTSYYAGDVKALISVLNNLTAGSYVADVTFSGDNNYNNKSVLVSFTVSRVAPLIDVNVSDVVYPGNVTANITVSNRANGTVKVTVDGKSFVGTVVNGTVVVNITGLAAGVYDAKVNFTYSDKDNYNLNASTTVRFVVNNAVSDIVITQNGTDVTAIVNVNATGNVTFYINGKKYENIVIVDGNATLSGKLLPGNNTVVVVYDGDKNFTGSRNNTNLTVGMVSSLVNVNAEDIVYGNVSEIVVNVPVGQTGYVTISVNGVNLTAPIKDGIAKFNVSGLAVGQYVVNVTYLGDNTYDVNKNSTKFNVTKNNITARVIAQNITVKDNVSFIVDIIDDFKGKVNITVDGNLIYTGDVKSLISVLNNLTAGSYVADVTFYGDANYNNKTLSVDFTVSRVTPVMNITVSDVVYPSNVTADIGIENNANGTVVVTVDGKPFVGSVENGKVIVNLTGLSAGVYDATVNFTSSDKFNNNVTQKIRFVVNKTTTDIVIKNYNICEW